jgi:hypothetical protein
MAKKELNYLYEDGIFILFENKDILWNDYIGELELVEDVLSELQEEGIIPSLSNFTRIYR